MTLSDPVANMLTIIRNSVMRQQEKTSFPFSNLKLVICQKLLSENFLKDVKVEDKKIVVDLKYFSRKPAINLIKKVSNPSFHLYLKTNKIKKYCVGGTYILTTSSGLFTNKEAEKKKVGGKVLLYIK